MELINDLKKIAKEVHGNVIALGIDFDVVENTIEKNNNVKKGYFLEFNGRKKTKLFDIDNGKNKTISIKKIRRVFKKKNIDYIICNFQDIKTFKNRFIRDSVYINKDTLYLYGKKDEFEVNDVLKKYKRYNTYLEVKEYSDYYLMKVDNKKATNNLIKDFVYSIYDGFTQLVDFIGDLMIG